MRKLLIGVTLVTLLNGCTQVNDTIAEAPTFKVTTGEYTVHNDVEKEEVEVVEKPTLTTFKVTAYCPCMKCCGKTDGITATGTVATAGRTIAVDPTVIPYGSQVILNGVTYTAEDCGGAIKGNKIDIYMNDEATVTNWGRKTIDIYIIQPIHQMSTKNAQNEKRPAE